MALIGPMKARRSNAKNSFDFLTDVQAFMLEEPKRIMMDDWFIRGKRSIIKKIRELNEEYYYSRKIPEAVPLCETVGCIAGTAVFLKGKRLTKNTTMTRALLLLTGQRVINDYELRRGDGGLAHDLHVMFMDTDVPARYGTMKYARIVAKRVKQFQHEHKAELLAIKV